MSLARDRWNWWTQNRKSRSHHDIQTAYWICMCETTRSKRRKKSFITYLYIEYRWIDRYGIKKTENVRLIHLYPSLLFITLFFSLSLLHRPYSLLPVLFNIRLCHTPIRNMSTDEDNDQQAKKHLFIMMIETTRFCSLASHIYVCMWIH